MRQREAPLAGLRKGFLESSIEAELQDDERKQTGSPGGELGACSRPRPSAVFLANTPPLLRVSVAGVGRGQGRLR